MRFLISVIDVVSNTGTPEEMAAIDIFNDNLQENGNWIIAVGIAAPSQATSFDNRSGLGIVEQGSKLYGTEYMSGFWLVDVPNHEIATQLAAEGSRACNRKVELRSLLS